MPTKTPGGSVKYFTGLPIPSSLGLTASMGFWVSKGWYKGSNGWAVEGLANSAKKLMGGKSNVGVGAGVMKAIGATDVPLGTVQLFGQPGGWGEVHVLSFLFLLWGAAMVSKTLRVSRQFSSISANQIGLGDEGEFNSFVSFRWSNRSQSYKETGRRENESTALVEEYIQHT